MRTLIIRWNGAAWKRVSSPDPELGGNAVDDVLAGVAATSSSNAWAVGSFADAQTLVLHWNGTAWKKQASPDPGDSGETTRINYLQAGAAPSSTRAWAVGYYDDGTTLRNLVLSCC